MKHLFLIITLSCIYLFPNHLFSQTTAVTEYGDTIYIYDDGTWAYELKEYEDEGIARFLLEEVHFDTSKVEFSTPKGVDKTLTSNLEFFNFRYKNKLWKRIPGQKVNPEAEIVLEHRQKEIYLAIISEDIEIGMSNIYNIAMQNAEDGLGKKPNVLKKEIRKVNGIDMIHAIYEVSINELKITFMSNYYSSENGTVQVTTWTISDYFERYKDDMEDLINGFELN